MKKKTRRLIGLGVLLVVMLAAAGYTLFIKPNQSDTKMVYLESPVTKGNLTVGVTESGSLSYGVTSMKYDLDLSTDETEESSSSDETEEDSTRYLKVEDVYVATGQRVSQGDAVLKFTSDSVAAVRQKLTNAKTEAEVALEEAQEQYNVQAISAKGTYNKSVAQSGDADSTYNITVQDAQNTISTDQIEVQRLQQEIQDLQDSLPDAEETLSDAQDDYADAKAAYDAVGDVNQIVTIKFQSAYLTAKTALDSAQKKVDDINDSIQDDQDSITDLQQEIATANAKLNVDSVDAKSTYNSSKVTGSVASQTYQSALEDLKSSVEDAQDDVDDLTDKLNAFESFVGDGTLYASGSGIITEVDYEADDYMKDTGTIIAFASQDDMTLSVDVAEEDVVDLAVGDPVNIVFTAYDDQTYTGKITSITTSNTSSNSTTVSYPVTISVEGDTSALYSGMTADVTFVTQEHDDVIYIAKSAIVEKNSKDYVYMLKNGNYELQEVTVGLSNGIDIEITDGLKEGDTVYIASEVSTKAENTDEATDETETADTAATETAGSAANGQMPDMSQMPGGGMPGGTGGNQQ